MAYVPAWLTDVPNAAREIGDGAFVCDWIESLCRITKDSVGGKAGALLRLRPWQRDIIYDLFARDTASGIYMHREGLIGIPRKNGKSQLFSAIGLWSLMEGPIGGEVYAVAGTKEQARILFNVAKRMVEIEPELDASLTTFKDAIEYPDTGSIFRVLSSESYSQEGLNPHLTLFDEVHVQPDRELWDVMSLAMGAREEPILAGITTAGARYDSSGEDSVCYQLYEHGKKVVNAELEDRSFYFRWWEPRNPEADYRSPDTWREANPGYDDLVSVADLKSVVQRTPEYQFRAKRCNQWLSAVTTWLPYGAWESRTDVRGIPDGADVVLAFDGSFSHDSTGILAIEVGEVPHIVVVGHWERTIHDGEDYRVPIVEVEDTIRNACRQWNVVEIAADPYRWARSLQLLEAENLPIVEFPQSPQRMTPATNTLYEAVMNAGVTHDGDPRLARHMGNAILKTDSRGTRLIKETSRSKRHIDLAVCAVMGLSLAMKAKSNPWDFVY